MSVTITHGLEKPWRYSIGASIENSIMECLSQLIMAKNAPKPLKAPYLLKASSYLEITTLKFRLCLELNLANETKLFQTQSLAAEIGRMLGGWLKSVQTS